VRLCQIEKALSVLEETRRIYTEHGTTWGNDIALYNGLAEAALWIAERDTMHQKANLSRANQASREALEHARKSRVRLPDAMRIRATCLWLSGDRKAAQKMWKHSLKLAQEQGQCYDEGVILLDMGSRLGDRSHLDKAIAILSEVGAEWDLARAHEALGKLSDQA
jgi:tetratricopeptide (TPR) repeat protein